MSEKYNYIEYGCLDWGPINYFKKLGYKCLSIIPDNSVFWDCSSCGPIEQSNYHVVPDNDILEDLTFLGSVLGLILVLDHVEDPIIFLNRFFELSLQYRPAGEFSIHSKIAVSQYISGSSTSPNVNL